MCAWAGRTVTTVTRAGKRRSEGGGAKHGPNTWRVCLPHRGAVTIANCLEDITIIWSKAVTCDLTAQVQHGRRSLLEETVLKHN